MKWEEIRELELRIQEADETHILESIGEEINDLYESDTLTDDQYDSLRTLLRYQKDRLAQLNSRR